MKRNRFIAFVAMLLALIVVLALFAACGEQPIKDIPETTDNYRTFYQIFPYSFADSNGDGVGDINGIIAKLDYIADMNFDGIWLTPVHKSPTYHKYDVIDYKTIDSKFGTLADYDRLVEECHKRGMTIILDLVLNHTSDKHEWFDNCIFAHEEGLEDDQYYNYYNVRKGEPTSSTWTYLKGSNLSYESQFWSGMPDLNWDYVLDEPNGYLAQDIKDIMKFWLIDHKIDGFRLDAVHEFFTGNNAKSIEALTWLNNAAKEIKPDCYIVGEGPWNTTAYSYYGSGIDSFFLFNHGFSGAGSISMAARGMSGSANWFNRIDKTNKANIQSGIPAMFIANHDTARAYGILQGGTQDGLDNMKMGYGVMAMSAGCTFWYYGDEIGMNAYPTATGKKEVIDEHKRQPMPWGDSYQCNPVVGSTVVDDSVKYPFGNVKKNLRNSDSLISYITRANALRRAFPAIARSYGTEVYGDGEYLTLIKKGEGAEEVYIAINFSHNYAQTLNLSQYGSFKLVGTLSVDKMPTIKGATLNLPAMSFAVLQKV